MGFCIEVIALLTTASNTIRDRTSKARDEKKRARIIIGKSVLVTTLYTVAKYSFNVWQKSFTASFLLCFSHFSSHSFSSSFIQFSLNCFCIRFFFFRFFSLTCRAQSTARSISKLVVFFYFYYHCLLCYHQAQCAGLCVFPTDNYHTKQPTKAVLVDCASALCECFLSPFNSCIGPLFVWSLDVAMIFFCFYCCCCCSSHFHWIETKLTPIHSYSFRLLLSQWDVYLMIVFLFAFFKCQWYLIWFDHSSKFVQLIVWIGQRTKNSKAAQVKWKPQHKLACAQLMLFLLLTFSLAIEKRTHPTRQSQKYFQNEA